MSRIWQAVSVAALALALWPASSAWAVDYEQRYINGKFFIIGTEGDLQVWASTSRDKELEILLYITNGSERAITFIPEAVLVDAVKMDKKKDAVERKHLRTFTAEEYEKKIGKRQMWEALGNAMAASMANQPQAQTATVTGGYNSSTYSNGYTGYTNTYGNYSGTITIWPSSADYAAANARTQAQIQAMSAQLNASFRAMQATLLRPHTLLPKSYVGGIVYAEKGKADGYVIRVPFGDSNFDFAFRFNK
jgi:hypothetical protein